MKSIILLILLTFSLNIFADSPPPAAASQVVSPVGQCPAGDRKPGKATSTSEVKKPAVKPTATIK